MENDFQNVTLDNDERRLITAFRRVRNNDYADILAKVHNKKLVALFVTDKWHMDERNGKLREVENEK